MLTSRKRIDEGAQRAHDAVLPPRVTHLVALALDDRGAHLASVGLAWAAAGVCGDVWGCEWGMQGCAAGVGVSDV